jgi:hypothetical protein
MKTLKTRTIIFVLSILLITSVIITAPYTINWFQWGAYVFLGSLAGVSAISEIIELLGRKKDLDIRSNTVEQNIYSKKNPFRPKFTTESVELFRTSVALWGPVASGKSWLINAFAYTLLNKYIGPIDGLKYSFRGIFPGWDNLQSNLAESPYRTQTMLPDARVFLFERGRTSSSHREALSSFAHEISIFDYSGEHSNDLLKYDNLDSYFIERLASTDIIIVTLDTTIEYLSKDRYIDMINRMFLILDKIKPEKKRFYAMCITKADTIPAGLEIDPNGLIELKFGSKILDMFAEVSKKHEIQTFITSSIGFIPGTNKPNFQSNSIIDKEHWKPYGVEFPFFWAFESIEKVRIKGNSRFGMFNNKNYIAYPKP